MDPQRFVTVFEQVARQAGAVAKHLQFEVRNVGKGGGSPEAAALTAVDLAAQDVILLRFADEAPQVAVDAEEDTELVRRFPPEAPGRATIVLDPIDGTLNYTRGSTEFAVMGSLLDGGLHRAAVVHFPRWDATWWAIAGGGCHVRRGGGAPERVRLGAAPAEVLVSPGVPTGWRRALAALGLLVGQSRCSAVDASVAANGRALAAVSEGRPDRRRAIGLLLSAEAGGVVRIGGRDWAGEDPHRLGPGGPCVVAADRALADRIQRALDG